MKVSLKSGNANCRAYGLEFDCEGVAECDKEVAQSLIDTGVLVEVKSVKKARK